MNKNVLRASIVLLVSIVTTLVDADTEVVDGIIWTYTVSDEEASIGIGDNYTHTAVPTTTTGAIKIPDKLAGKSVTTIASYTFYGCSNLTSVTIPNSVTRIEDHAFVGCSGLTNVAIPEGVTSIENAVFSECRGLTSVTMPSDVTSIGNHAFWACVTLANVTLPEGVTYIGKGAFEYCRGLTSVTIPSSVTSVGSGVFDDCSGLTSVTIPSSVVPTFFGNAFDGCYLANVTVDGSAFVWLPNQGLYDVANKKWIYSVTTTAKITSTTVRESDPTIIDVTYRVYGANEVADVRALAFLDGMTSFVKAIRPETFVDTADGSPSEIGAGVSMRTDHKFAWKVSADYSGNLAKIKMQVFAKPKELLPLELRTIPANGDKPAYEVSINTISDSDVMNALFWLYAENTSGLTLSDGVLRNGSTQLASGTTPTAAGAQYLFQKMSYTILNGTMLNYVNTNLRLSLSPSGTRQYGYKKVSSEK